MLSNQVAGTVVVFSMEDQPQVLATTNVTGVPAFAGWLSSSEFVVPTRDPSGAARVDAMTGTILAETQYSASDCDRASEVTLLPDGRLLLVCEGTPFEPGSLVQIDRETLEIQTVLDLGFDPARLAVLHP